MQKEFDIHKRVFSFVVRVLHLIRFLPKDLVHKTISEQLIRSSTSIGANDQEANGVNSKKDFIHCYTIVRKELLETSYWLSLIAEMNPGLKARMNQLISENQELVKITSTIIKNAKV